MISQGNLSNLVEALQNVQDRMAYGYQQTETREQSVFISVAITDRAGNTQQRIETKNPTSSVSVRIPDASRALFAPGIPMKSKLRRMTTLSQISAYICALNNDDTAVVQVTLQVTPAGSATALDYVVQTYFKNDALVQKEVDLADRS